MKSFENLIVWQKAHEFTIEIYRATKIFPKDEQYGLTSQIRRATLSVPTNIVEGRTRETKKDFLRFLEIAKGSLEECEYLLIAARDLNYLSDNRYQELDKKRGEVSYLLKKLRDSIKKKL